MSERAGAPAATRVALIGLGNAARTLHLPALRSIGGATLVGGSDPDAARRREWEAVSATPAFDDPGRLLAEAAPDVVVIATPPATHASLTELALAAGAHVVCEKPLARSVAEAERMLAAADRHGRKLAVNHPFRTMPIFEALSREVRSGRSGGLVFLSGWQLLDLPTWQEPGWRGQLSHGTLYEAGIHIVDLALELFGGPPAAVFARTYAGAAAPSPRADPIHLLVLEWPDGRLAQLTFNRLYKGPTRFAELRADTERASLRASYGGRAALRAGLLGSVLPTVRLELGAAGLAWAEIGNRRRPLARNPRNVPAVGTARLLERILEALRRGEEPPSSGREARDVLAVVAAAYASARTGLRVELAEARAAWREEDLTRP